MVSLIRRYWGAIRRVTPPVMLASFALCALGCDDQPECIWDPQVETDQGGSCVISTDAGETNCWGGLTVTCVPSDGADGGNATFHCDADGESPCGIPIELNQPTAPSCDWFVQEANYETYTAVWAECWEYYY